jgi:hypothetical protein
MQALFECRQLATRLSRGTIRREWGGLPFTVVAILLAQQSALSFANLCYGFRHPCRSSFLNQRLLAALL